MKKSWYVRVLYGHLGYISAIWYMLWPFGNLVEIWYITHCFGTLNKEQSGSPASALKYSGSVQFVTVL
jgi:hypothetical protein